MFKKELEAKLKKIFGFEKTTFDAPSDAFEQDTLFIELGNCKTRTREGKIFARVEGQLIVFSQSQKYTYGFMNKRIEKAGKELTKAFFFHEVDVNVTSSPARLQNIEERRTSFVFLYSDQYDPSKGHITSIEFNLQEE